MLCGKYETNTYKQNTEIEILATFDKYVFGLLLQNVSCTLCNAMFSWTSCLKVHMKTVHSADKCFKCPWPECDKDFTLAYYLKLHTRYNCNDLMWNTLQFLKVLVLWKNLNCQRQISILFPILNGNLMATLYHVEAVSHCTVRFRSQSQMLRIGMGIYLRQCK